MKKILFTFFVFFVSNIPYWIFADLGDSWEPAVSCNAILAANPSAIDWEYYLQSASMVSERKMYCNMSDTWWGWILLFQRRWWSSNNNTESCWTHLNNFLQNSCWNTSSINYGDSYSSDVALTLSHFNHTEYLFVQENSSWVKDNDDNYTIHSTQNIFPNSNSGQNNFSVSAVCDANDANCDSSDTKWIYVGTSWFNSSTCSENNYNWSTNYKWNYWYCHNGFGGYWANSLFWNRSQYNETKLWSHGNWARNYMERVYVRKSNIAPVNLVLSNTDIATWSSTGSTIWTVSATDDDGDTLTYSFATGIGDLDNWDFSLSWSTLSIGLSPDANVKDTYNIRLSAIDWWSIPVEKSFVISVTWGNNLGSSLNPWSSCLAIKNARPGSWNGNYYVKSSSMGSSRHMYCDMQTDGWGWMMLFQRRWGTNSIESCWTHLNNFLQNSCWSIYDIDYSKSYSSDVQLTLSQFSVWEYLLTQQNNSSTIDTDDAFIAHTSSNIFPNSDSGRNNFNINQVCDINNANCDNTNVKWTYVGNSWFSSALCSETNYAWATTYKWNYWYCHNNWWNYSANSLFWNRSGYSETKLWNYPPATTYMERVYIRDILNDTTSPTISWFSPGSWSLFPSKNPNLIYNYSDDESWINIASWSIVIQKWLWASWGIDLSNTIISWSIATWTSTTFQTDFTSYGKYQIIFTVSDYVWNTQTETHILYIDEPEFIVSTPEVDMWILNNLNESHSPSFTVTVKTLWASFDLFLVKNTDLYESPSTFIPTWNLATWYGYQTNPFVSAIEAFQNSPVAAFTQSSIINTNGEKNTYVYEFRLWWKISNEDLAWIYEWSFDVRVNYGY